MKILSPAISRLVQWRNWSIDQWMQDLVTHGQYTELGRKYGLDNTFTIRQFKERVPIHDYELLKPYIERMMQGEENLLWNTPISWFAKSSGTTSDKSKFIPVSEESLEDCHFQASKDVLSLYYRQSEGSDLLTGKGLIIGGSHQISQLNEDISFGDLSAVLLQNTPIWANWIRTPDLSIALMDEWETKIERLAEATITEDVTSIAGVPTWTLVLIKRILAITGKTTLREVWPNLELYIHGGVSFAPYRSQFQQIIGEGCQYLEIYNASEGFFAAQDRLGEEGMLLFLNHGIFYEFLPMEEIGKQEPTTIGLQEVEVGKTYAPVISTNGGLWRYLLGDTIRFTSIYPFRVVVNGRIKQFINAFGEEVVVDNTDQAIRLACEDTGAVLTDYTAAPIYFSEQGNGAHEWLIEFSKPPYDLQIFTEKLDASLQSINSDYEAKRYKSIALGMPSVRALPPGLFNRWLKSKGKLGGQHKVPRLSNERKYIEEILLLWQQEIRQQ
jgi:hypothetical protein